MCNTNKKIKKLNILDFKASKLEFNTEGLYLGNLEKLNNKEISFNFNKKIKYRLVLYYSKPSECELNINLKKNSIVDIILINVGNNNANITQNINLYENSYLSYYNYSILQERKVNVRNQINIFHKEKKSSSFIDCYGILKNASFEVNCVGNVDKKASDSSIIQNIKCLLLNKEAKIVSRPILNIYNKDIIAKHALAIGNINKNILYYLKTRGLSEKIIKKIIFKTTVSEMFKRINNDTIKQIILPQISFN